VKKYLIEEKVFLENHFKGKLLVFQLLGGVFESETEKLY